MRASSSHRSYFVRILLAAIGLASPEFATAHGTGVQETQKAPAAVAVQGELPPPPLGVSDLKFREFYKMPVGPRGLEPTEKLLGLNGKRVRLVGYMVRHETPSSGVFILSPTPASVGDEDEWLADDLPVNVAFVYTENNRDGIVPHMPELIKLTGILSVGGQEEADGRISSVRLLLDPELSSELLSSRRQLHTN